MNPNCFSRSISPFLLREEIFSCLRRFAELKAFLHSCLVPSWWASFVRYVSCRSSSLMHTRRSHTLLMIFCRSSVVASLSRDFSTYHSRNSFSVSPARSVSLLTYSSGSIFFGCSTSRSLGISLTLTVKPHSMARAPFFSTFLKPAPSFSPALGMSLSGMKQSVMFCMR